MLRRLLVDHRDALLPPELDFGFVYNSAYFHRRLKEEFLRTLRTQRPFIYIKIPTEHFELFGFRDLNAPEVRAWKIAVLTILSQTDFLDVKGQLQFDTGIGVICLDSDYTVLQKLRKSILRNLKEANLLEVLRQHSMHPLFRALVFTGEPENQRANTDAMVQSFNRSSQGFFSLEPLNYKHIRPNQWNSATINFLKRATDIVASTLALIVLLPFLLLIALLVKISDPKGPAFFKQTRVGQEGKHFIMYKFRSMYTDAEARLEKLREFNETTGPIFKMKDDPRVFKFGKIIRKYSLDELPQLVNIIKGDMAIVGPRPPLPSEVEQYESWHRMRLSVKPGLTCHWQVSGRSNIGFEDQVRLDNKYIRHGGIKTDMELIRKTFKVVFKGDGAY